MSMIENETLRKTTEKFTSEYSKFSFFFSANSHTY